ncbi:MAG: MATE family efflux transporter [Actinomycetota bacterium]|nr:MATE family efflux transporter [Actinomycetota bacterium]MDA3028434.1 MATE family efflux transporter [Actinomycetota bacterium]
MDRRLLSLAWPALGALAVEPLYVAVDTAIIGRVGTDELAGLAGAATVLAVVVAGSNFLAYGTTERVAHAVGAGRIDRARALGTQALWAAFVLAAAIVPALVILAPRIVGAIGLELLAADHAVRYLRIAALGVPAILIAIAAQGILRGVGDYRRPLWVLGAGNLLNVVIELPLVFIYDLSVTGSALSTVISQWAVAFAFIPILSKHISRPGQRRPDRDAMTDLLGIGAHLALRVGSMMVVLTGASVLAARSGVSDLAGHQIVAGVFMLVALTLDALAVPAHTLIGQSLGSGDRTAARQIASRVMVLSSVAGALLGVCIVALASPIARVFTTDPVVRSSAVSGLVVLGVLLLPGAIAFAGDGILIGAGDHRFLGIASLVQTALIVPMVLIPKVRDGPGVALVWTLLAAWMLMRAVTVATRSVLVLR